jgi:hypothetical protein
MTEHVKKNAALAAFVELEYQEPDKGDTMLFNYRNSVIDFSTDYNLLMPVAEKLVKGYPFGNKYFSAQLQYKSIVLRALEKFDKEYLFETCYKFITFLKDTNQCK